MLKKYFVVYVCALCILIFFPIQVNGEELPSRGLLVSVVQEPSIFSSRQDMEGLVDFAVKARIKILYVQIYRANLAWFPSKLADQTPYEICFKKISEDPFSFLIKRAHAAGLEVYAWFNMLTLSENKNAKILKKYGPEVLTRNLKTKKKIEDYKIDSQYFLEPGDPRVRAELIAIVEEVLRGYPKLDGVLFDYIRYPDEKPAYGYTPVNIERFKKATGLKAVEEKSDAWKNWKGRQVTEFLEMLVKRVRSLHPDIHVAATGCMPYVRAYYEAFQDWPSWLDAGVVESVTVMNYSPDPQEFESCILGIRSRVKDFKKVNIGVGAYKLVNFPETFKKEWDICEKANGGDCVIFHYGSLLQNSLLGKMLIKEKE
ncbi:MAG: family 10 glycosylhydrolase [Candidatus Omnitrophica bacterium]|nr:family 10 glycosylhydrolase [Candidatus Omnitrophota bacterium]